MYEVLIPSISHKNMNIPIPKSFSNIGRTADAANKRSAKVHVHKKMVLQPWDGLDLVEQILAEAHGGSHNAREQLHLSSPRVNPVLQDKEVFEGSTSAMSSFLLSTAKSIENLPAACAAIEKQEIQEEVNHSLTSSKGKGRAPSREERPSPSFLTGVRPSPSTGSEAPAVGKYAPKYKVIERRAPTPVIGRISRKKQHAAANLSLTAHQDILNQSATATDAHHAALFPNASPPLTVYRKHGVRDVSSAFRSGTPRGESLNSLDLSYWPLPTTGSTTYSAGAFHANARERPYTPFGTPQGTKADYNVKEINSRPASSLSFGKMVNREEHKTRLTYPTEDTTNLDYRPNDKVRSDRSEVKAHYSMVNQTLHPQPRSPTPGDGLGPYTGSMVTSAKRGFVDIKRMVGRAMEFAIEDHERGPEMLHPDYSQVVRMSPAITISKTSRDSSGPGKGTPNINDVSYEVSDTSIRRHRPVCVIPRGTRSTFVVKTTCQRQEPYDSQDPFHVSSIDFAKQISRDIRDKRFEFK